MIASPLVRLGSTVLGLVLLIGVPVIARSTYSLDLVLGSGYLVLLRVPLWLLVSLVAGTSLLIITWVLKRPSRPLLWTWFLLFVFGILYWTDQLVVMRTPGGVPPRPEPLPPSLWIRDIYVSATAWGLAIFILALAVVAVCDRTWKPTGR